MRLRIISFSITLLLALFFTGQALAGGNIQRKLIFNSQSVAAGGYVDSEEIDFVSSDPDGYVSLQIEVTGDGTIKIEPLLSNDAINFLLPSGVSAVTTGFTKTSGPNGDGKDIFTVDLGMLCASLKFRVTETGGVNSATITATVIWQ